MIKNRIAILLTVISGVVFLCKTITAQQLNENKKYSWDNLPEVIVPVFREDTLDIRSFGAIGDGRTLNTESINTAIQACSEKGGGVVLVPSGYWMSGPIVLKNDVNLHLDENAFLQFTPDFDEYKIIEGNYEGKPSARNESPISGKGLKNIAITGRGTIDGSGDAWRMVNRDKMTEKQWKEKVASGGLVSEDGKVWFPSHKTKLAHDQKRSVLLEDNKSLLDFEDIKDYLRPNLLVLTECENILLENVTFQNSPAWNLHPLMCENLTIKGVLVKNPSYAQNGDGIDIESCSNVLIEGCTLDVGDDAICIKSGKDEEGRKRGMPTQRVVIKNNKVYRGHGGFVVGSEMSGGARDIFVEDCTFMGTDKGIRFKTTRGRGGLVENIHIRNINMFDIDQEAIYFDMYYWTKPPKANEPQEVPAVTVETPQIRGVFIENISCRGADVAVFIRGLPEMPIENINMVNLNMETKQGVQIKDAVGISIDSASVYTTDPDDVIYVESSRELTFNRFNYDIKKGLIEVHGERSKNISLSNTEFDSSKASFKNGSKSIVLNVN